jgi:hypothetical protein
MIAGSLCLVSLAALALSGCGGTSAAAETDAVMPPAPIPVVQQDRGPSDAARMTCDVETQATVGAALALRSLPMPTSDWSGGMFTCIYNLDGGPLVLTVKELADPAGAQRYFEGLRQHLGVSEQIEGLPSFGLPAAKTAAGVVIFAKDNMTLEVDASAMPERIGPYAVSRPDFAYQIASGIIACWKAHP